MTKKQDISKTYIIITIIIGLAILGYGFMDYSYKTKVLNNEAKKEEENSKKIEQCIATIKETKKEKWDRWCFIQNKAEDCSLGKEYYDEIVKFEKNEQEKCYQLYK